MKKRVLIVDDLEINRDILSEILEDDYETVEADNGETALAVIEKNGDFSVILLDLIMPKTDGFAVLRELQRRKVLGRVPVLVISGESSVASEKLCLDLGANDFIHKPFDETIVKQRVNNAVQLFMYKNRLEDTVEEQHLQLLRQNEELKEQARLLEAHNSVIIDILGTVVESRNLESGDHIKRVKSYTKILCQQMLSDHPEYQITQHTVDVMTQASVLHDVGKIAIADNILLKPGRLTPEEFDEMKKHTVRGCELIANIEGAWNEEYKKMSYDICRWHHERFDGRGYPDGLEGDEIPISAQIVSIADVYDALVSKRVYKDAYSLGEAYDMILGGQCGVFSSKLLASFEKVRKQFEDVALSAKKAAE